MASTSSSTSAPSLPQSTGEPGKIPSRYLPLYRATRNGDWETAAKFLEQEPDGVRDFITSTETALMLVVRSSKRNQFLKNLLERMSPADVARQDMFGQTALIRAVKSGNNVAAKLMVEKNPDLPNIVKREPIALPVNFAAQEGNREMVDYLLAVTNPSPFEGQLGVDLLNNLVYGELYGIPLKLEGKSNKPVRRDVENSAEGVVPPLCYC